MKEVYELAIFGAGVIGACIFNKLCKCGHKCVILDKYDVCSGASKANSAIIHAGFDAETGTNKAKFNVLGSKMYSKICKRLNVPYKKIGAFVLGNDLEHLNKLFDRGISNGLKKNDLQILNREQLINKIPNLAEEIKYGLYAKNSAIVNPFLLNVAFIEEGIVNSGKCYTFFDTKKISYKDNIFKIESNNSEIYAKKIINASGWGYNDIATLLKVENYDITYRRGEYLVLDNNHKKVVNNTLFPLPNKMSKGTLVTTTIDGNILIGPTATDSENITKTTKEGIDSLKLRSNFLINDLDLKKVIRQYSGIRTIIGNDFIIEKSKINSNVINIAGICSPGLSCAPSIALYVLKLLNFEDKEINTNTIKPFTLAKDLSKSKFNELVKKDKNYGQIVCKCEKITKGDIINCLNRPLKCFTLDGVKRRVRAGMGRCQSGFCMDKVAKIISEELNIKLEDVIKEYPKSYMFLSDIKENRFEN